MAPLPRFAPAVLAGALLLGALGGPVPGAAAQGQSCAHPYFSVREGVEWRYRAGMPSLPITMTEDVVSLTNLTPTGFSQVRQVGGDAGTIVQRWTCVPDGLSQVMRGADVTPAGAPNVTGTLQTSGVSGVTLPPAGSWQPGYSWKESFAGTFSGLNVIPGQTPTASAPVERLHTIVGQEPVTVPAGTMTAWRVDSTSSYPVTVTLSGQPQTFDVTMSRSAWYVEGMGLVKSVDRLDGDVIDQLELISVTP